MGHLRLKCPLSLKLSDRGHWQSLNLTCDIGDPPSRAPSLEVALIYIPTSILSKEECSVYFLVYLPTVKSFIMG